MIAILSLSASLACLVLAIYTLVRERRLERRERDLEIEVGEIEEQGNGGSRHDHSVHH